MQRTCTVVALFFALGCSSIKSPTTPAYLVEVPNRGTIHVSENLVPHGTQVALEVEKGYMQAERELGRPILLSADGLTILATHVPDVYGDYADWLDTIRVSGGPNCPFACFRVIRHEMQHRICFKMKLSVNCYQVDHTITLSGEPK